MFSWMGKQAGGRERAGGADAVQTVTGGLRALYLRKVLPLEEAYRFHEFHSPALEDADFENKPMILLVGQYSTGKTTFIRHLIEQDFPGMRIGPEPTTDSFIAVMHGPTEGVVPGNALVVDPRRPFRKLNAFGNAFLNRYASLALGASGGGGDARGAGPDPPAAAAPPSFVYEGPGEIPQRPVFGTGSPAASRRKPTCGSGSGRRRPPQNFLGFQFNSQRSS